MPKKNNKVKFNICNVHYALLNVDETGEITFGTPVAMPGRFPCSLTLMVSRAISMQTDVQSKKNFAQLTGN